jgi:SAM-dependent methyltransferase
VKEFYEDEARRLSHQEMMYLKGDKHTLWWHRKRLGYILSFLSEIFDKDRALTFADIGCAEGFYVKYVSSVYTGSFCIGVDIARSYITKAKMGGRALNTDYVVCDIENLPFSDCSIEVLLCSEVLEHVSNYKNALAELFRVGKRQLMISFPGHSYLFHVLSKFNLAKNLAAELSGDVGHVSEVTVEDVQKLSRNGHDSISIKIGGALPLQVFKMIFSVRLVEALDELLCRILERFGAVNYSTIHVIRVVRK